MELEQWLLALRSVGYSITSIWCVYHGVRLPPKYGTLILIGFHFFAISVRYGIQVVYPSIATWQWSLAHTVTIVLATVVIFYRVLRREI